MDNLFDLPSQVLNQTALCSESEQRECATPHRHTPASAIDPEVADHATTSPVTVENVYKALLTLETAIDTFSHANFSTLSRNQRLDLSTRLFKGITRIGALRSSLLAVIEREEDWKGAGSRTFPEFETKATGVSLAASRAHIKSATTREEKLPHVRQALLDGSITDEHARVLDRVAQNEDYAEKLSSTVDGEAALVAKAKEMDAGAFAKAVKKWQITKAPSQAEKEHRLAQKEEKLLVVEEPSGWRINGWLTSLNGQIVTTALSAAMGVPSLEDPRTPPLRRANALVEICRNGLDTGAWSGNARVRPHVSVHIQHETLTALIESTRESGESGEVALSEFNHLSGDHLGDELHDATNNTDGRTHLHLLDCHRRSAFDNGPSSGSNGRAHGVECGCLEKIKELRTTVGEYIGHIRAGLGETQLEKLIDLPPAELDDGTPLLPTEVQTLLCDSELQRILFSTEGEVLDVGREHRLCTNRQVRAVIARDRHCRYPGCSETIGTSQIHHAIPWESGGRTDIDNLVMLCWHHHRVVHAESVTIHHHRNGFVFTKPGTSAPSSEPTVDSAGIIIGYSLHPACAMKRQVA